MKVLVVCSKYPPEYAGSGLRAHRTYLRLRSNYQVEAEVVCSSMTSLAWRNETYAVEGVRVTRIASPLKRRLLEAGARGSRLGKLLWHLLGGLDESARTLAFLLRRGREFEAVHTFGHCWSAGVAAIWAGATGRRILRELVTMRSRPDDPPGVRALVRWALRRRGVVIAISPLLAERASRLGYPRVWRRPNPVDEARFRVDRSRRDELRRWLTPFEADDVVLLDLSKYSPLKNKETPLHMMPLLPHRYKLVLAGPLDRTGQRLYERLRDLAKELGIEDRVHMISGFISRPEDYFHMTDVFLFPSLSEGLGTPILEAIACGIPVVAHRIAGVTDWWIREGVTGYTCDATPEQFAECVERAAAIPREVLDAAASELLGQASTAVIDRRYFQYLTDRIGA